MNQLAFQGLREMRRTLAAARAECEELRDQLAQAQKMETLGHLAGGLAHDMNNVLACIVGIAGPLREDLPADSALREDVDLIVDQALRATGLTRRVLAFARRTAHRDEEIEIAKLVGDATQLLVHTLPRRTTIRTTLDHGDARVVGDPCQLWQALVNLCINASDAMEEGGTVALMSSLRVLDEVESMRLGARPGRYLELRVIDHGHGMDAETLGKAIEPFFTTKPSGKGTGLGLAIVARTMRGHGGALELESEPGRGTQASLLLPLCG